MNIEKILKGVFILSTFAWGMMTVTLVLSVLFGLGLL